MHDSDQFLVNRIVRRHPIDIGDTKPKLALDEEKNMQRRDAGILYSASDLVNFLGCTHATVLDVAQLEKPVEFPPEDEQTKLLQEKGLEHERDYLERLRAEGRHIVEIDGDAGVDEKAERTRNAMRDGADVIYQGAFRDGPWQGYSDFLLKVPYPSSLGDFSYEVADTKLSRSAKPKHLIQMCIYSDILTREQGRQPDAMHVVLGDGSIARVRTDAVIHYFGLARDRFLGFAGNSPAQSEGTPCGHCTYCRWAERCGEEWEAADHLSLVAGLTRGQAEALNVAGVPDLRALAALPAEARIDGIQHQTLWRLREQARLQDHQRQTGERVVERLDLEPGRGLARLPRPDRGDMFFDMEGDPLFDGGLEYLFGITTFDGGEEQFHAFWAHDRDEEKQAFQAAVDFMVDRIERYPGAHIYHYAAYEETALKRLAMFHGTRENAIDDFLRQQRLVDLYRVVREAIRTSEPAYSIKNMEKFYLQDARGGEVTTAGDSIVMYERWRRLGNQRLLDDIEIYNRFDCASTLACRDWLVSMRGEGMPWLERAAAQARPEAAEERNEVEMRLHAMSVALIAAEEPGETWRQLVADLLEFHGREAKPDWWAMFSRQDLPYEALLDDPECLAGLEPHPGIPARPEKRSVIHTFTFPAQDFKLRAGSEPVRAVTLDRAGTVVSIDEDHLTIELKLGPSVAAIAPGTALIPPGPVPDKNLRLAIYRLAEAVRDNDLDRYSAVVSILRRDLPTLRGREPGAQVIADDAPVLPATIEALQALQSSHLLVQGPPGAGKTYTASHAILALLAQGYRVGITAHGHKAINQLLGEVETLVAANDLSIRGIKKNSRDDQQLGTGRWIEETTKNDAVTAGHQLVAGTAWLFARPEHDQAFDYLFVDEAGQFGIANVVAAGVCARNIVLVGDQMQLAQPIKGTHPRASGTSALRHVLQDNATVPPERGVFLSQTRRMHPDLCAFVSAAVYDNRLTSAPGMERQSLIAPADLEPGVIAPAGLRFVTVESVGCTQRSQPEADRLAHTYGLLLGQRWRDKDGLEHPITVADILVVSPYNMQVELLKRLLPMGARVGTVDKFQGQEAAIVLISMATSSGDDLPRNIEFLYSQNRLNVAISRARCLAVIYANPRLMEITCNTIPQMELVNNFCWAMQFAAGQAARV